MLPDFPWICCSAANPRKLLMLGDENIEEIEREMQAGGRESLTLA
jgi:hypothetical protein